MLVRTGIVVPGVASVTWGSLAISAGGLDVCYFSLALGGPFTGAACRAPSAPDGRGT